MSQRTIKHAWSQARLEELANKIGSGATPRGGEQAYQTDGIPLIRSQNVVFFNFKRDGLAFISEEQARLLSNVEVLANDVLLNITGASIGRVTIAPQDMEGARVNQHVCIIRPVDGIEVRYLNAYLSSPDKQAEITNENYGVTRQALTKQQIADFIVPVPPLNEQKRIGDKIDAVLARVDACRERLDRVPGILKRFRQSVLRNMLLTQLGIISDNEVSLSDIPNTIQLHTLCASNRVITYGVIKLGEDDPHGIPCLRTSNVKWLNVDVDNVKSISKIISDNYKRTILEDGDVLVNVRGTLGGVAVASEKMVGWNVSREVAVVSPDKKVVLPVYLALWIAMDKSQEWLADVQKGVAYVGINIEDLKRLPVLIPTISEQHEIVRRVEALFAYSDTLEAKYRKAREQVDQLAPALLAKAFRGELVPQDPSDEPAEKLLESIRVTRSAQPAATRTRRTRTPRQAARSTSALSVSAMPAHVGLPTTQTSLAPPVSSFDPTSVLATPTGSRTLADLRKAAGLNQAAVAKSMGLNQAYISQMETGKRAITEDQRCKLAEILGVRVEDMPW